MNSSIALRLLWKEYRVQRGLWLSMAAGSIMLQMLIAFLVPSDQESFQGILPIAFMLTGFYAVGSGAITFAIEREEGTQLRPVMLGCPPGLTLTVKTIFGIVATALLLASTICSGMLLSLGSLTLPENTFQPEVWPMMIPLALLFVALPYLGCLLWSTFFSLLTRKVIVALGLAAVAMIATYIFVIVCSVEITRSSDTANLQHPANGVQFFLVALLPCSLALLILGLNYLLTHRWLTRAFFDQSAPRSPSFFRRWRIRRSGLDGGMVVEIGVEDRTAFEVVSSDVAVRQPPPRFGLSLLYATWGPNLWRHLRFLRWREAIETRKLFVGVLLATMVFVTWNVTEGANHHGWHGFVAFFVHAACLACGAMAFRTEQDERKVQRLADMGLRPATVWLSKHVVWFTRAIMSVAAILFCVLFVSWLYPGYSSRMGVGRFFDGVWLNAQLPNSTPGDDSGARLVGRAIILTLTMYSIGQFCSQLIRSTIVSLFASFLVALTAFGWAGVCWYFGVPFILSVLPLAIGCLLVTWCRTHSWMIDDNRGRAWLWPAASITAALAVVYFGTGLFRVYEIPSSKPFFSDGTSAEFDDGLTDEQRAFVMAPVTLEERQTFEKHQRASELFDEKFFRGTFAGTNSERWVALSEDARLAGEKAIQLAVEAAESPTCAEFSPVTTNVATYATSTSGKHFAEASDLLLFDGNRNLEAGHPDVALQRFGSALAVARHAAGRGAEMHWRLSHTLTSEALRELRGWAKHADVDRQLIDKATRIVDEHRRQMIPVEVTNFASGIMIRNTLDADMFTMTELVGDSRELLPMMLATKFPGEVTRSRRLLNAMKQHDVEEINEYRSQVEAANSGESPGMSNLWLGRPSNYRVKVEFSEKIRLLLRTTPLLAMISRVGSDTISQDIRTECEVRATKVVLRLLLEQRESGKLPATLDEFDESLNDPWSNRPFIWYPEGLPGNLMQQQRVRVKAGTPFLITTGYKQNAIRRLEYWDLPDDDGSFEPTKMGSGGGVGGDGQILETERGNVAATVPNGELKSDDGKVANESPDPEEKQAVKKLSRVEYVVDGWDLQPMRPDVVIWELPRNQAAKGGTPASAEDD